MKKMFKTMLSAICAVTMLTEAAMPVFAIDDTSFFNEDGSYNYETMQQVIDENAKAYGLSPILYEANGSTFTVCEVGSAKRDCENWEDTNIDGSELRTEFVEKMINDRFNPEIIDGKYYMTLDGEKYEYYFAPDTPEGYRGDYYFNTPAVYMPTKYNPYSSTQYRYTKIQEDGTCVEVNSDKLTYVQMLDLCFEFYMLQKEKIIMANSSDIYELYRKGKYGNVDFSELSEEDIIKGLVNAELRSRYSDVMNYVEYDIDSNRILDVRDLAMIKRYLIDDVKFTLAQEVISAVDNYSFKPDIRTVTKVARKIVKLED